MNKTPNNKIYTSWMVEEILMYVNLCPTEKLLQIYNDMFGHEITIDRIEKEKSLPAHMAGEWRWLVFRTRRFFQ